MFDPKLYPKHYLIAIWREYCFYSILHMLLLHILSSMHRIHSHVHGHCKPCNLSCQNTCVFQIEWAVPMRSCPLQVCPCPDSLIIKGRGKSVNIFDPLFLVSSPIVPGFLFLFLFLSPQPPRRYFFIFPDLPRRVGARDTTHRPPTRGGNRGGRSASPESDGASTTARRRGAKCSSS
jgi:hypothetical protein